MSLSHLDEAGRARMVDVGGKPETERTAVAEGQVRMSREAFELVAANAVAKGDVLAVAEVAGVMAAKRTGELIPLCHPLGLDVVTVEARLVPELPGVRVTATAKVTGRTGVEMEALTAVSVACLTVYDMVKADRSGDDHRRHSADEQDRWNPGRLAPLRSVGSGGCGLLIARRLARETTDRQVQRSRPTHAAHAPHPRRAAPGPRGRHRHAGGLDQACARHRRGQVAGLRDSPHAGSEAWATSSRPPAARWT